MAKKIVINKDYVQGVIAKDGYPEVGTYKEQKDLQKFYKHCTMEQLIEWVELEGLEVKPTDSEPIMRMRLCMAVLYAHFPKEPTKGKKKSKYSDYDLDALVSMAIENDVAYEPCEDERIHRMRVIMALRANKVIE